MTFIGVYAYMYTRKNTKQMAETLPTTPHESQETPTEVPLAEQLNDEEKFQEITARLHEVRARVAGLSNEEDSPTEVIEAIEPSPEDSPASAATSENEETKVLEAVEGESPEKIDKRDPQSRLRRVGDFALKKMEDWGKSAPIAKLEAWGLIDLRGRRHKQFGLNFSAVVARRYMKAQKRRGDRIAGFLSEEANAQLNGEAQPTPDKPAEKEPTITEELRDEAHTEAEAAAKDKAERKDQQPAHERDAELRQKLHDLRGELGARALATARR